MRRTTYQVAGGSLQVEAEDAWTAAAIDHLFAGWYLGAEPDADAVAGPSIVLTSQRPPVAIPEGLPKFDVAGGGQCAIDGATSYIEIDSSTVAIGAAGRAPVEVRFGRTLPLDSGALTRLVTYALSAALRLRHRFELHSAAVVDPASDGAVLIVGPSGSGKSTLAVHMASAGWPFLTDDVLVLGREGHAITAWPLRRRFAITATTYASSEFLQARTSLDAMATQYDKQLFLPHDVFSGGFRDCAVPAVVIFAELTGAEATEVRGLSSGDVMARLMRMSPWCCYDRVTAPGHLAVLSALSVQARGYQLRAGTDMLDPRRSVDVITECVRRGGVRRPS